VAEKLSRTAKLFTDLSAGAKRFREKTYPEARNKAFEFLLQPGGRESHQSAKDYFHRQGSYKLTKTLGRVLPPQIAANLSDFAYLGNEAVTGALAKAHGVLSGKDTPFESPYGFSWKDVATNRRGQQQAIDELNRDWSGWEDFGKYKGSR